MKKLLTILLLIAAGSTWAQEQIAVPLSSPDKRGKLEVSQVRGNIIIEAYNGKEVIIEAIAGTEEGCDSCDDHDHGEDRKRDIPSGMKRISSSPVELEASESNNVVEVETNSWKKPIDLNIKIPANFDLEVSTVHGKVEVAGINGTHEISSVNGPLTLKDMSGSIISNTVNGTILVNFKSIKANEPMSFVTLNGDVDVTFPANVKARAKMKSDRGEIFTDFEMTVDRSKPEVKTDGGAYKVSINSWVFGDINGGGPEFTFKNMHGDIIIRKE
ncbi:MAG: DUF4097 family beta strand repeat-containing protein [Ekhidna sp.]